MSKFVSFIFLSAITVSLSVFSFGQSGAVKNDLKSSFKKFDLIRINTENALRQAESQKQIYIQTGNKNFQLNLIPRDLRSPQYRAEDTTVNGTRTLEKDAVTTFKGTVGGESNSEVRLTIDETKIEGYFVSEGNKYFIEPARRHSESAAKNDFIVYREGDLLAWHGFNCESDIGEKLERGKNFVLSNGIENLQGMRVLELATEADFLFVSATGGANATNNEILGTLNMVEGVFERELNITFSVVFQHTWSVQDPFNTTSAQMLLNSFRDYWNANYANVARDAAHLWSAKTIILNQGLAYSGVICNNPSYAYAVSGRIEWQEAKNLITAHEIGHNLGASHAEESQSCGNTLMNSTLYVNTPLTYCSFSRTEILNFVSANGGCLSPLVSGSNQTRFDFDRDGKADVSVFRPSTGGWYIANSSGGYSLFQFGQNGDKPVSADYDGDGRTDAAVYRGGNWYRLKSSNGSYDGVGFGLPSDLPAPADFDGDGKADVAVFRPSSGTWFVLNSSNGSLTVVQFGANGDIPMPGDYDGDGKADFNVFRPSTGAWFRLNSSNGSFFGTQFGQNGDKPISADFDGDGKYDLAVFRQSNGGWYIIRSSNGTLLAAAFGMVGDLPTAADFDGDGKADISVFRPSTGNWFRMNSSNNSFAAVQFGVSTDSPIPSYYVQ